MAVRKEQVLDALKGIAAPNGERDIVAAGWVCAVDVRGDAVTVVIEAPPELAPRLEPMRKAAEEAIRAAPGVARAAVALTAHTQAAQGAPRREKPRIGGHPRGGSIAPPGVKRMIAVASGKGGVGKSTTAVNLAAGLSKLGLAVGLCDADIYGPSAPRLVGLPHARAQQGADGRILPLEAHGLKVMSIGFMIEETVPVVWRGPMVAGALEQLLRDVDWGALDVMIVDMPPGTGDAQLTMGQRAPLCGAAIVSTPQDIALIDARKGLAMFEKVKVPILGVIENMSYHVCSNCGWREDIFNHGGARKTAKELGCDFLGEIPLDIKIRETADAGTPIVIAEPDGPHARAYLAIAETVKAKLTGEDAPKRKKPFFGIF